jgi:hypothetical protein
MGKHLKIKVWVHPPSKATGKWIAEITVKEGSETLSFNTAQECFDHLINLGLMVNHALGPLSTEYYSLT